ncbi:c-type cytochrome [Paraglaciecola sp. 25GB23A]|uniref:c-type cytochrome n=1 Tax=Paraglaciecola sp. 25GB23A TaxID=3156068 RepID=UPI0032B00AAF
MMKILIILLTSLIFVTPFATSGELNCQMCHGSHLQGNVVTGAPALNNLSTNYIEAQLNAFKQAFRAKSAKDQAGLDMRVVAMQLSQQEIAAALALVKKLRVTNASSKPSNIPASWQTCVACHGANGEGNDSLNAPAIMGQQPWYLFKQLHDYQEGQRGMEPADEAGQLMRQTSLLLSAEEIKQLSQFLGQSNKTEIK